jgi:hypothetical protein
MERGDVDFLCGYPPESQSAFGWVVSQLITSGIVITIYFTQTYRTDPRVAFHIPSVIVLLSLICLSMILLMRVIATDWYCGEMAAVMYIGLGFLVGAIVWRQAALLNEAGLIVDGKQVSLFPIRVRVFVFVLCLVCFSVVGFFNLKTLPLIDLCQNPFGGNAPIVLFVVFCILWLLFLALLLRFRRILPIFLIEWCLFGMLIFFFLGASVLTAYKNIDEERPLLTGADPAYNLLSLFLFLCQLFLLTPAIYERVVKRARGSEDRIELQTHDIVFEAGQEDTTSAATKQNDPFNLSAHRQALFLEEAYEDLSPAMRNQLNGKSLRHPAPDSHVARLRSAFTTLYEIKNARWVSATGTDEFMVALELCAEALVPSTTDERHKAIYFLVTSSLATDKPAWIHKDEFLDIWGHLPKPYSRHVANEIFEKLSVIFASYLTDAFYFHEKKK